MEIAQEIKGDVAVVTITGEITLNQGADVALKDKVHSLLQQGYRKIVLDLGGVSYVDSSGLGQLVQVQTTAVRSSASLKLSNVTKRLNDLLVVTRLVTVFDTYTTEDEAVASFSA